jgi:predicted metal-binding membrane protein
MRYWFMVTDFAHDQRLTHLSESETRLSGALARPRRIAFACVVVFTAAGWMAIAMMSAGPISWQALCRPAAAGGWSGLSLAAPMWIAMTLAMMLPTAGPMILTYAEIADTAARKREPVVSPLVLTAGYVAVWIGFAVAAALLQFVFASAGLLDAGKLSLLIGGTVFVGAGLYQFSTLKQACLALCQRPFPFFFANWTTTRSGVMGLGLRQGMACLGCCWAMMLLMFAVGAMNVVWMAGLGVVMTIEKLSAGSRFSKVLGVAFFAIGLGMVAESVM